MADLDEACQQFAREEGIDLEEKFGDAVPSPELVLALLTEMPEVESAYQPSGALPATAVPLLLLGAVVGCVVGGIAGALSAGAGLAISGALFHAYSGFSGFTIIHGMIIIAGFAGACCAMGYVSAWCTTEFGKWGKNRSMAAAVLLAVLASVAPIVGAGGCYYHFGPERSVNKLVLDHGLSPVLLLWQWEPVFGVSAVLGAVFTASIAAVFAACRVQAAKFCESCQTAMQSYLKTLTLGRLRAFVRAFRKGRMDVAESLLPGPSSGWEGEVRLYSCPCCSRGYLEVTAKRKVLSQGGGPYQLPRETTESWLAMSRELSAKDVERLRPLLERG
jgi:MFS family permease